MNTFQLKQCTNGDLYFDNLSPMFPASFEKKINQLAGEPITQASPPLGGFFGNFVNTFVIPKDKIDIFRKKVLSNIGYKVSPETGTVVWNKDEEVEANLI